MKKISNVSELEINERTNVSLKVNSFEDYDILKKQLIKLSEDIKIELMTGYETGVYLSIYYREYRQCIMAVTESYEVVEEQVASENIMEFEPNDEHVELI